MEYCSGKHLFDQHTADLILKMRVSVSTTDKLIWKLNKNGNFTLKSAYKKLFEDSLGSRQFSIFIQGTNTKWKDFWIINTWPRVKHFFWKCLNDILPTRVRLQRQCGYISKMCALCNQHEESTMHLFFQCAFLREVWMEVPRGSQALTRRASNIAEVLEDWISLPTQQQSQNDWLNLGMVVTWSIWNERCEVIFQNKNANPKSTAREALSFAKYLSSISDKAKSCIQTTSVISSSTQMETL